MLLYLVINGHAWRPTHPQITEVTNMRMKRSHCLSVTACQSLTCREHMITSMQLEVYKVSLQTFVHPQGFSGFLVCDERNQDLIKYVQPKREKL